MTDQSTPTPPGGPGLDDEAHALTWILYGAIRTADREILGPAIDRMRQILGRAEREILNQPAAPGDLRPGAGVLAPTGQERLAAQEAAYRVIAGGGLVGTLVPAVDAALDVYADRLAARIGTADAPAPAPLDGPSSAEVTDLIALHVATRQRLDEIHTALRAGTPIGQALAGAIATIAPDASPTRSSALRAAAGLADATPGVPVRTDVSPAGALNLYLHGYQDNGAVVQLSAALQIATALDTVTEVQVLPAPGEETQIWVWGRLAGCDGKVRLNVFVTGAATLDELDELLAPLRALIPAEVTA